MTMPLSSTTAALPHREAVIAALDSVQLGDTPLRLYSTGRISGISIKPQQVGFVLQTTAAEADALEAACQQALLQLEGVARVTIVCTQHAGRLPAAATPRPTSRPTPAPATPAAPARTLTSERPAPAIAARYRTDGIEGVRHIIAIASGKGGVGKSSLTVLLAHALTAAGEQVGIVDADIHGPSIPRMLGLARTPPAVVDGQMQPALAHGILANSIGLIAGDSAAIWRGPMVSKALQQLLRGSRWWSDAPEAGGTKPETISTAGGGGSPEPVSWRSAGGTKPETILLIDLPPGTGDIQLSLMQAVPVSAAIIVTTPQEVAREDAHKAASMFSKIGVPILGVVENMSYFTAPDGSQHALFGAGGGGALAAGFGVPLMAQLPLDPAIGNALDTGELPPYACLRALDALRDAVRSLPRTTTAGGGAQP